MDILQKYFPSITEKQKQQFEQFAEIFKDWNSKINLVSRKDIDNLFVHHILHSMSIAKIIDFKDGTTVLDLGTGGGFPGIPLAIMFPKVHFTLMDSIGKKIMVVNDIVSQLQLDNVTAIAGRAEEQKTKFDFIVTRAVAEVGKLMAWTKNLYNKKHINALPNGLIALKGSTYKEEFKAIPYKLYHEAEPISKFFKEEYFKDKYVIYIQS